MRTCPTCGSANGDDSAAVCWRCGAALAAPCPSCGEPLPSPNARFCPACGTALADRGRSDRERKLVTVVFADVTGSTGLGERLDPESLKEVMDAYFSAMREELEAEGGTVEKFIG
ncbi:MAG TPA: hypothetical protein DIT48_10085, partial [Actinobacteria bacterium]|nr:hypothetical protein [Actinomycetota bacterium]